MRRRRQEQERGRADAGAAERAVKERTDEADGGGERERMREAAMTESAAIRDAE